MKDRRVEFRISKREYNFLEKNLPSDFETMSDFLRGAALYIAKNPAAMDTEYAQIESNLEEIQERIISEIQKNRNLIMNLVHSFEGIKAQESKQIRENLIHDLIEWYQSNKDTIRSFDDLYDKVTDPFLKEVIPDAIQLLKRRGTISISNTGKVVWHD